MATILLERAYLPHATFGVASLPDGFQCYTVELPWANNKPRESCIPPGRYVMRLRESPIVQRTSRGRHDQGWEVTGVPDRTYIMWHPANHAGQLDGCLAPGSEFGYVAGQWAVLNSVVTFYDLMARLAREDRWDLVIRTAGPDHDSI